jgi:CRISPR-associated endonuclease/helicase Cas3
MVRAALADGKRVLWVVNTVRRAHEILARFIPGLPAGQTAALHTPDGVPVYCYHSRFRLADRVDRHRELMAALRPDRPAALGVTTQVCEMSLDIDVDLLVTEDCPVTALVQRMGRCNSRQDPRPLGQAGNVLVYKPDADAPYDRDALTGLDAFLNRVTGRDLSQDDLEKAMRQVDPPPSAGDPLCSFLASGPYAVAGEEDFRDSEEHNRPCVLPEDVTEYLKPDPDRKRRPGLELPVPKKYAKGRDDEGNPGHRKLPRHLGVAFPDRYHAAVGYCDDPLDQWGAK